MLCLENKAEKLNFIVLNADGYWAAIADAAGSGIGGGMTYDTLLARCALKARAETIYTCNVAHFQRLGTKAAKLVRTP